MPNQAQSFVLSVTPMATIDSTEVEFAFTCASGESATTIDGVNTLLLSASDTPVADVVALSATAQNTGILSLDDSVGAFALATINLGAADSITVTADTGSQALPVQLSVCETNSSGGCLSGPAPSVTSNIAANGTPTFSVFSNASAAIANDPAVNRVFVRFTDSNAVVRGGTSVALENQVESQVAEGVPNLAENSLAVLNQGLAILDLEGEPDANGVQQIDVTTPCEQSGQLVAVGSLSLDPTTNTGTLDTNLSFENCDGLTGTINLFVVSSITDTAVTFDSTQTGSYTSPECSAVTLDNVQTSTVVSLEDDDESEIPPITTSGNISGVCGTQSFSCTLDGVDIQDEEALQSSCITE